MKVAIVSATDKEVLLIKESLNSPHLSPKNCQLLFIETGVGTMASCYSISKLLFEQNPDLIIQIGIAGTFDNEIKLGDVIVVTEEILADVGVEEDGTFKDIFDLNLSEQN